MLKVKSGPIRKLIFRMIERESLWLRERLLGLNFSLTMMKAWVAMCFAFAPRPLARHCWIFSPAQMLAQEKQQPRVTLISKWVDRSRPNSIGILCLVAIPCNSMSQVGCCSLPPRLLHFLRRSSIAVSSCAVFDRVRSKWRRLESSRLTWTSSSPAAANAAIRKEQCCVIFAHLVFYILWIECG